MKFTLVPDQPTRRKVSQNASYGRGRLSVIPGTIAPGMIVELDAVSAYPPELISKYKLPKATGDTTWCGPNGPRCSECNRGVSLNFLENNRCGYCRNGVK